jgi:hypothetical protein
LEEAQETQAARGQMNFGLTLSIVNAPLFPPYIYVKSPAIDPTKRVAYVGHVLSILCFRFWWKNGFRPLTKEDLRKHDGTGKDYLESVDLTDYNGGPWQCVIIVNDDEPMHFHLVGPNNIKYQVANRSHAEVIMAALNALEKAKAINESITR